MGLILSSGFEHESIVEDYSFFSSIFFAETVGAGDFSS